MVNTAIDPAILVILTMTDIYTLLIQNIEIISLISGQIENTENSSKIFENLFS